MSALTSPAACPDVTLLTRASGSYLEISNTSVAHGYLRLLLTFGVACAFDRFAKSHHIAREAHADLGDTGQAERKQKRVIDEHSGIRDLKHRWDEEDKTRYELERQAQRAFLEQEANELFAPLENYLTRLDKVLHQANAAVEIDPTWEHLDERKLRRTAKVILRETAQHLPLDLTIEGVTIFYRNRPYRFTRAIEALIPVITSDVEQFIIAQGQATTPAL